MPSGIFPTADLAAGGLVHVIEGRHCFRHPSMGLAPHVAREIFAVLGRLNRKEQLSILVAEQSSAFALRSADRAYVLETGRVVLSGAAAELRERDDIQHFYLGSGADGPGIRPKRARPVGQPVQIPGSASTRDHAPFRRRQGCGRARLSLRGSPAVGRRSRPKFRLREDASRERLKDYAIALG
jgi:hypothetical protein